MSRRRVLHIHGSLKGRYMFHEIRPVKHLQVWIRIQAVEDDLGSRIVEKI